MQCSKTLDITGLIEMPRKSSTVIVFEKTAFLSLRIGTVYERPKLSGTHPAEIHKLNSSVAASYKTKFQTAQ